MLRRLLSFARHTFGAITTGSRGYYRWIFLLFTVIAFGFIAYIQQLRSGFVVTNLSDQIAWGAYIANFTFLVGAAAATVMLVIPAYLYKDEALKDVVVLGEQLAFATMVMSLLFVTVDLGRPDRFWHLLPVVGRFNWPLSLLSWDVIALCGYLVINGYLTLYLVYTKFHNQPRRRRRYLPLVFLAIPWAVGIKTVCAFLYSGLGGRPAWHAAILAPRFLASAFASGPALLILALTWIRYSFGFPLRDATIHRLRQISAVSLVISLYLFGSEVFTELYPNTQHASSMRYLLFGLHGHNAMVPYSWTALGLNVLATIIFTVKPLYRRRNLLLAASAAAVLGSWLAEGITFVVGGFVPTPLGEVVDYLPSMHETTISAGIWAFGALIYTFMVKATVPIEMGTRHEETQ